MDRQIKLILLAHVQVGHSQGGGQESSGPAAGGGGHEQVQGRHPRHTPQSERLTSPSPCEPRSARGICSGPCCCSCPHLSALVIHQISCYLSCVISISSGLRSRLVQLSNREGCKVCRILRLRPNFQNMHTCQELQMSLKFLIWTRVSCATHFRFVISSKLHIRTKLFFSLKSLLLTHGQVFSKCPLLSKSVADSYG